MPARIVQAQDRLEFAARLGKRSEVHGRDPGQAVTGEANYRVWQALRNLPSLVDQAPHRRIVAAHEGIHKLAAESCDERLHIAEPLAQNACTMIRGAGLRSGI